MPAGAMLIRLIHSRAEQTGAAWLSGKYCTIVVLLRLVNEVSIMPSSAPQNCNPKATQKTQRLRRTM